MSATTPNREPSAPGGDPSPVPSLPGQLPIFLNIPPPLTPVNDTTSSTNTNETVRTSDGKPASSASSELDQRLFLTDCSNSCVAAWTMTAGVLVIIIGAILLFVIHRRSRGSERQQIDDFKPALRSSPKPTEETSNPFKHESDMSFSMPDQRYLTHNYQPQERTSLENSFNYVDDSPITPRFPPPPPRPPRLDTLSFMDESRPPSFTPPQPPRSPVPVAQQPKFFEVKAEEHEGYYIADEEFQFHPQQYHNEQEDEVEEYYMPQQFEEEPEEPSKS